MDQEQVDRLVAAVVVAVIQNMTVTVTVTIRPKGR